MLIVQHMLLCLAAFCVYGVYSAEGPPDGRFGRRTFFNNSITPTEAATGETSTGPQGPTPQALTHWPGSQVSTSASGYTLVEQASSLLPISASSSIISEAQSATAVTISGAHGNLDTLTSGGRPPPPPPGFSIITFKPGPGATPNATTTPNWPSGASGLARPTSPLVLVTAPTQTKNWYFNPTVGMLTITYPTVPVSISTPAPAEDGCNASTDDGTVTRISVIHTSTITWTEDPADYTPPFPEEPLPCTQAPTGRFSASLCPVGQTTCDLVWLPTPTSAAGTTPVWGSITATRQTARPTVIFWTTDKNPVVVFSSTRPPDFLGGGKPTKQNDHETVRPGGTDAFTTPVYGKVTTFIPQPQPQPESKPKPEPEYKPESEPESKPESKPEPKPKPEPAVTPQTNAAPTPSEVTVVIQTTQVIINGQTFTDNPQVKSTTAVIGTDTFTIDPTRVVGHGSIITRPFVNGVFVPVPSTTTIDGLRVVYGPSAATIDGTSFAVGASPTTVMVGGKVITVGPNAIFFPSQVLPVAAEAGPTHMAVIGGTMITAVGQSVFVMGGTSITYGPNMSPVTESIGKDKVTIGPSGVIVSGSTLGGLTADATATTYKVVGGATVTEIGSTAVAIDGITYSVGAGATLTTTTVIAGQTLTISPNGVAVSTDTYAQPYATTIILRPGSAPSAGLSSPTAADRGSPGSTWTEESLGSPTAADPGSPGSTWTEEPKNAGATLQLFWKHWVLTICIVIGTWA